MSDLLHSEIDLDNGSRAYRYFCVSYAPLEFILSALRERSKHWLYCYHCREPDPSKNHIHFICSFHQWKSYKQVRDIFSDGISNTFVQQLISLDRALHYLTHEDDPSKVQYSSDEFVSDDLSLWLKGSVLSKEDSNKQFLDDLLSLSSREMAIRYGRDFIRNYDKYQQFADILKAEARSAAVAAELAVFKSSNYFQNWAIANNMQEFISDKEFEK